MPSYANLNLRATARRQQTQSFTPLTRYHHPRMNADFPEADLALVPKDLCIRGGLMWTLSQETEHQESSTQDPPPNADKCQVKLERHIAEIQGDVARLEGQMLLWGEEPHVLDDDRNNDHESEPANFGTVEEQYSDPLPTSPVALYPCAKSGVHDETCCSDHEDAMMKLTSSSRKPRKTRLLKQPSMGLYEKFWYEQDGYLGRDRRHVFSVIELEESEISSETSEGS